ncbi:MAG: alpha-galactosidase [Spirochaetales bacterium]|nr:alpha-galactosidase [Spirochaetales bacterium]
MNKKILLIVLCCLSTMIFAEVKIKQESNTFYFDYGNGKILTQEIPAGAKVVSGKDFVLKREMAYTGWEDSQYRVKFLTDDNYSFVFVKREFKNVDSESKTFNRFEFEPLSLPSGVDYQSFGTGGNMTSQISYTYGCIVEKSSHSGYLGAWLTGYRGSGLIDMRIGADSNSLVPRLDYGKLYLEAGQSEEMEIFIFSYFEDLRDGLELFADLVADEYEINLKPQPTVYCTWYHIGSSDQVSIRGNSRAAHRKLQPYGFSVVQIDDGWQAGKFYNGPKKDFTKVNKWGRYSGGMKPVADYIKSLGLVPGIWYMPFAGTWNDPFFADKQDLFVKREDGTPYDLFWGGTSLDMSNPKARAYTADITNRITNEWGYEYIKIDGLWTGLATGIAYENFDYVEDGFGDAVFFDKSYTNVQAYREGLKTVREASNPQLYILGCNLSQNMRTMSASFGLVDGMRIGPDNGPNWDMMKKGPFSGATTYFLNKRVWHNDPDPVYVRPSIPYKKARSLVSWVGLTGQLHSSSIDFRFLPKKRIELLQKNMPAHNLFSRPADLFDSHTANVWVTPINGTPRTSVGFFNWEDKSKSYDYDLSQLGLDPDKSYVAFDFWEGKFYEKAEDALKLTLEGGDSRILSIAQIDETPVTVATNRHTASTSVDLFFEKWDSDTLSADSLIVGGEEYLAYVAIPKDFNYNKISESFEACVDVRFSVQVISSSLIKISIKSKENTRVSWKLKFER